MTNEGTDKPPPPAPTPAPKAHRWLPQSRFLRYLLYSGLAIIAFNAIAFAVLFYFGTRPNLPYVDYFPEFKKLSIEAHARHGITQPQPGQPDAWVILEGIRSRAEKAIDPWIDAEEKRRMAADPPDFGRVEISNWCRTLSQISGDVEKHADAKSLHDLINRFDDAGVYRFTAMLPTAAAALPTKDDLGIDTSRPSRMPILVTAQVLCLRARLAAESDDAAAALTRLIEADAVADRLDSQPTELDRLLATAVYTTIDETAISLASRRRLPATSLKQVADLLNAHREPNHAVALTGGRAIALHTLQSVYYGQVVASTTLTKSPHAAGADPQAKDDLLVSLFFRTVSPHSTNAAAVNHIYDLADQADAAPFPQGQLLESLTEKALDATPSRLLLAKIVTNVLPGAVLNARAAAWHAAARTAVAIERFRQVHGTLPTSLDDLVPTYLLETPKDPFAPDQRLRYRPYPAATTTTTTTTTTSAQPIPGYTLNSVGYDQTDNNATPAKDPFEAMRDIGTGTDYLFVTNTPTTPPSTTPTTPGP